VKWLKALGLVLGLVAFTALFQITVWWLSTLWLPYSKWGVVAVLVAVATYCVHRFWATNNERT
jgi:hypothetical protein